QLPDEWELRGNHRLPEMAKVEIDDRPVRRVDRSSLRYFMHERLREPVARSELHTAEHRLRFRLAEVVVLQVPVAVLVDEMTTLGARCFRDEDARERQAGGMVLDELHGLEWRARAIGD